MCFFIETYGMIKWKSMLKKGNNLVIQLYNYNRIYN